MPDEPPPEPVLFATCFLDDEDDSSALHKAFKLQFPNVSVTKDDLPALLGQRDVDLWYKRWKYTRNSFKALPTDLRGTGLTGEIWSVYLKAHETRAKHRKAHAAITKQYADEHKERVKAANDDLKSKLATTDTKLVRILEAKVSDLPLGKQAELVAIKDEKARSDQTKAAIAAMVKSGLTSLKLTDVNDRTAIATSAGAELAK